MLLAKEEVTKVVKNFRHEGRDYSIIQKDPGGFKKKTFVFLIDGEMFSNNGKGWATADQTYQAIKQYVRDPSHEAVATGEGMEYPAVDKALGEEAEPSKGETIHLDPAKGSKKYKVRVLHDANIYCDVTLNANDAEEAEEQAFELARNGELNWDLSEGNPTNDPYLGGNEDDVQEVE